MLQQISSAEHRTLSLEDYAADAKFAAVVAQLKDEANRLRAQLDGRRIWMINSTAEGGGVAEMLPRLIALMNELGLDVHWAVLKATEPAFFRLTKRIHNLIHDDARAGTAFSAEDAALYEAENRANVEAWKKNLRPQDILIVHDPQPLPLGQMLVRETGVTAIWRCHIGFDQRTAATRAVWRFLRPYLDGYRHSVFSVPSYIPSFLSDRASIIFPAIDPLSHKNRELTANKIVGILCNSGLQAPHHPVATPDFAHQVQRLLPDGTYGVPGEMGLLFRPIVLQVSRWDRLKGWLPLLDGFVRMKHGYAQGHDTGLDQRYVNRIELSRLVLAGPDPASIADDPEGLEAFDEITARYRELDPAVQDQVAVLVLPMQSRKENALIVNALQRTASVTVQNSLREGFGLTATEAMWKRVALLGTRACGIQMQVRHGVDGLLTDDPTDAEAIARNLRQLLGNPVERDTMGRNGQRRVYEEFLVFTQIRRYLNLLTDKRLAPG